MEVARCVTMRKGDGCLDLSLASSKNAPRVRSDGHDETTLHPARGDLACSADGGTR